jgi:hypothetical protein
MRRNFILAAASILLTTFFALFNGCKDPVGVQEPNSTSESKAFMKLADNSPSVTSFTQNYNEEAAMNMSRSLGKDFYPVKVGQKLDLTFKSMTIEKDSATAIGTLTQKYEGKLFVAGTFQKPTMGVNSGVDTVIVKPFSTTITRMIKFERINNTGNDTLDWKITGISLPVGGTDGDAVSIQKITLTAQDGSEIVIDNPNTFFFDVGKDKNYDFDKESENDMSYGFGVGSKVHFWKKLFTWYRKNQNVNLSVEVLSTSSDPDLLTLTYGASMNGKFRTKEKFDLVSTVQEGNLFRKVYERSWRTNSNAGRKHAVINALPRYSVYDSDSVVVEKTWGIPYKVQ